MCHFDWFNKKKLNGQYLGRIWGAERTLGRRKVGLQGDVRMHNKQCGHYIDEVNEPGTHKLIEMG